MAKDVNIHRAEAWLAQAENDFDWGEDSLKSGHFAQTCYIAQQVGEKAIKSVAFFRGADMVKSHSIVQIAESLKINGKVQNAGMILDQYYMNTRYPDSYPDFAAPYKFFNRKLAEAALKLCQIIVSAARKEIKKK
jgi:HEPN domain-containing protein